MELAAAICRVVAHPPIPTSVPCSQAVMGRCLDSMPITCSDIANSSLATPPTAPDGLSILQSAGSGTDSLYYDNCASEPNILWPNFNSELVKIESSDRHPVCFHTSFVLLVETPSNALVCTFCDVQIRNCFKSSVRMHIWTDCTGL